MNGILYLGSHNGTNGVELWKTDGTSSGTIIMVKDIHSYESSYPTNLSNINGTLFLGAVHQYSNRELFKSDGTNNGTIMVKDIGGGTPSDPSQFTDVNGTLFFSANDYYGFELWKSDGGPYDGTVMVKDLENDSGYLGLRLPSHLTNVNGTLFFCVNDGTNGVELWRTDGTSAGTTMVKDIYIGQTSSSPMNLTAVNDILFLMLMMEPMVLNSGELTELLAEL